LLDWKHRVFCRMHEAMDNDLVSLSSPFRGGPFHWSLPRLFPDSSVGVGGERRHKARPDVFLCGIHTCFFVPNGTILCPLRNKTGRPWEAERNDVSSFRLFRLPLGSPILPLLASTILGENGKGATRTRCRISVPPEEKR